MIVTVWVTGIHKIKLCHQIYPHCTYVQFSSKIFEVFFKRLHTLVNFSVGTPGSTEYIHKLFDPCPCAVSCVVDYLTQSVAHVVFKILRSSVLTC